MSSPREHGTKVMAPLAGAEELACGRCLRATVPLPSPPAGEQRLNRHSQHTGEFHQLDVRHASGAQLDPRDDVAAYVPAGQLTLRGEFLLRQSQAVAEAHELRAYGVLGFGHAASILRRKSVPCLTLGLCVEIHTSHSRAYS
jgi:hypothetical protein